MTTQELEAALVSEKEKAEKALGCDMCKKYARCLYCFSRDEFRCAKAHDRLMIALEHGTRKFPAYLLHEPPVEVLESYSSAHKPVLKLVRKPSANNGRNEAAKEEPETKKITVPNFAVGEKTANKAEEESEKKPAEPAPSKTANKAAVEATKPVAEEEADEETLETIAHILSGYKMDSLSEERSQELMKISAMLDSGEEEEDSSFARAVRSESDNKVLARTKRIEGDVPLLVIRKRK